VKPPFQENYLSARYVHRREEKGGNSQGVALPTSQVKGDMVVLGEKAKRSISVPSDDRYRGTREEIDQIKSSKIFSAGIIAWGLSVKKVTVTLQKKQAIRKSVHLPRTIEGIKSGEGLM